MRNYSITVSKYEEIVDLAYDPPREELDHVDL